MVVQCLAPQSPSGPYHLFLWRFACLRDGGSLAVKSFLHSTRLQVGQIRFVLEVVPCYFHKAVLKSPTKDVDLEAFFLLLISLFGHILVSILRVQHYPRGEWLEKLGRDLPQLQPSITASY